MEEATAPEPAVAAASPSSPRRCPLALVTVTAITDYSSAPLSITPLILYQILRGHGFPTHIVLMRPTCPSQFRALVQFDSPTSLHTVLAYFGQRQSNGCLGREVHLRNHPDAGEHVPEKHTFTVHAREATESNRVFATTNTNSTFVAAPAAAGKLGPVFPRHFESRQPPPQWQYGYSPGSVCEGGWMMPPPPMHY